MARSLAALGGGAHIEYHNPGMLHPELIAAYRNAHYVVFGEPGLVLRIGEPNAELDALLEAEGAAGAAYLTAANPRGERRSAADNELAVQSLERFLRGKPYRFYEGEGRDGAGNWQAERSFLVVGIGRAEAEALGRRLGQNAIVFAEKGGAPELVILAAGAALG